MLKVLLSILSYDLWFYASHIVLHKYMWDIHAVHHSTNPDQLRWSDAYVSHPVEDFFQGVGMFFPHAFLNYTVLDTALILFFLNLRGMARHESRKEYRITWQHHVLHHKYMNYNYGEYWIDCACGTLLRV